MTTSQSSVHRAFLLIIVYSLCNAASSFAHVQVIKGKPWLMAGRLSSAVLPEDPRDFGYKSKAESLLPSLPKPYDGIPFLHHVKTRVVKMFQPKDSMTSSTPLKQRLKERGVAAFSSFSFVQNGQMAVSFCIAWFLHASRTGFSPLAPGQWKLFLALNAALGAASKTLTPIALALSISSAPWFQTMFDWVQERLGLHKAVAIGAVTLLTSLGVMVAITVPGVAIAAAATGVPIFP